MNLMLDRCTILFVGSIPPPITGQSFSFLETYRGISCKKKILIGHHLTNKSIAGRILGTIAIFVRITYRIIFDRPDIVYFTGSRSLSGGVKDIYLIFLAKLFRISVVNHLHGTRLNEFFAGLPALARPFFIKAYRKVDVNIVLLREMVDELSPVTTADRVEVVPNFYDRLLDTGVTEKATAHSINLLYLSNIMLTKGVFELMAAFARLSLKYPNLFLNIAGDFLDDIGMTKHQARTKFETMLASMQRTQYLGAVSGIEKRDLLFRSDIFILPTYYSMEAFPLSILEAMRAGNYIVTTNHNYLPAIVGEERGSIIEPTADAIVAAIEGVVQDQTRFRRVQSHNVKDATENYSFTKYIGRMTAIFDKLAARE